MTAQPDPALRPDPDVMAARYGGPRRERGRLLVILGLIAGLVVALALGSQVADLGRPSATADQHGYTVEDETRTTVRFTLHAPPGTRVACTLVAVNETFTQVGYRQLELGPYEERSTGHEVEVTTNELATSGSVEDCQALD